MIREADAVKEKLFSFAIRSGFIVLLYDFFSLPLVVFGLKELFAILCEANMIDCKGLLEKREYFSGR